MHIYVMGFETGGLIYSRVKILGLFVIASLGCLNSSISDLQVPMLPSECLFQDNSKVLFFFSWF
jgi:hypothetical protein